MEAPLPRALGHLLGLGQPALAQGEGRTGVLGHVELERLARLPGRLEERLDLSSCRRQVAHRDEGGHPPGHGLGDEYGVADPLRKLARLAQLGEHLRRARRGQMRRKRSAEHGGQRAGLAETPRHAHGVGAHRRGALVEPDPGEGAAETGEQHHPERVVTLTEPLRGLLQQVDRVALHEPGAPPRLLEADGGTREEVRVAPLVGDRGGLPEPLEGVGGAAAATAGRTEVQVCLAPWAGVGDAELQGRAQPRHRVVVGERRHRQAGRAQVVVDRAVGDAERGGGREVVGQARQPPGVLAGGLLERPAQTRRCSSARRGPLRRSSIARRTSSCAKRYASGACARELLDDRRPRAPRPHGAAPPRRGPPRGAVFDSSKSGPAIAASSNRSVVPAGSRRSLLATTSRTLRGLASSASGGSAGDRPPPPPRAPRSRRACATSRRAEGVAAGQVGERLRDAANWFATGHPPHYFATSSGVSPPSRSRTTPSARCRSASASESSGVTSASSSR